jgi:TonB-dependent receptor
MNTRSTRLRSAPAVTFPRPLRRLPIVLTSMLVMIAGAVIPAGAAGAAPAEMSRAAGTGVIQGRVTNAQTGEDLERARVTVEGAGLETFTDTLGRYYFGNVPAGEAKVKAFRTGLVVETATVAVAAGQVASRDFNLSGYGLKPGIDEGAIVKLSQFVVAEARERDGAAIAINEQRFAADMRNVITADEFGQTPEGNVGDLLKFVPGITINTGFGMSRGISLNGVPDNNVPVTMNGFNVASPLEGTSRQVDPQNLSTNNISRIEVLYSPTPETPGMALAGSVNVVPRSAFERSMPVFNGNVFVLMRDDETSLSPTPGPGPKTTRKIHPGFNFSYLAPVSDRWGYTLSGGMSRQYLNVDFARPTWRGVGTVTNGTTYVDTTPDKPYLSAWSTQSSNNTDTSRYSLGTSVDYKIGPRDRVSFSFNYVYYVGDYYNRYMLFDVGGVQAGNFGPTFTRGTAGLGSIRVVNDLYRRANLSYSPNITYRHDGPIWKADAGLGYSRGMTSITHASRGYFFNAQAQRTGVTVALEDIAYDRPGRVTVTDGPTGARVDPFDLRSYLVASASFHTLDASPHLNKSWDLQQSAYANLGRDFYGRVPLSVKAGADVRQLKRDLRIGGQTSFTYVGADGLNAAQAPFATSDNGAGAFVDTVNTGRSIGFSLPAAQWLDNYKLYDHFKARPAYFTVNDVATHTSNVNNSKYAEETISSAYLRGDLHFFERRLKVVGGVRAEQTNVTAEGPLNDASRNFQRDASGKPILGANGRPLPITTDPLASIRLTLIDRGMHAEKEYLRLFPSLNAIYNVRENLIARAAYYQSLGRPNLNQYAGGITLPDLGIVNTATQRITVQNAGIKAWSAQTVRVMLEYYFPRVGLVSVAAFRREFKNFFGSTVFRATPEFLDLYSLDPAIYGIYDVQTQENLQSRVRMEGLDINYKQALTFLPHWARGLQVFGNASSLRALGEASANFTGFVPRTFNGGFSFAREKYNMKLSWNYRGRNRGSLVAAGRSIAANTYRWGAAQKYLTFTGEYYFHKTFAVYADLHNAVQNDDEIVGAETPGFAKLTARQQYRGLWTFGVRGSF